MTAPLNRWLPTISRMPSHAWRGVNDALNPAALFFLRPLSRKPDGTQRRASRIASRRMLLTLTLTPENRKTKIMKTNQPSWHCIANLGDATPLDHGGDFLMIDKRGTYDPEIWHFEPATGEWSTLVLDACHLTQSGSEEIGCNRFHPSTPEWFGDKESLESAASTCGTTAARLRELLLASSPMERADGYLILTANFGFHEFDQYPDKLTRKESAARVRKLERQISSAEKWIDGF